MEPLKHPTWISPHGRFGVGVRFACPTHPDCWLELFFKTPMDGFKPDAPEDATLYAAQGGLGSLSLYPPVEMGDHGTFWVLHGHVVPRL